MVGEGQRSPALSRVLQHRISRSLAISYALDVQDERFPYAGGTPLHFWGVRANYVLNRNLGGNTERRGGCPNSWYIVRESRHMSARQSLKVCSFFE